MLNILWAGLVISSIIFALGHDLQDEWQNPYANGRHYEVKYQSGEQTSKITFSLNDSLISASLPSSDSFGQLIIDVDNKLPALWQKIAQQQSSKNKQQLRARVLSHNIEQQKIRFILPEVHWIKIRAVTQAAFDMAEFAIKLAIGLVGIMALWLGLMKIAEASGLILIFVKLIRPLLSWLFPDIPKNHPALGSISLNLAANVLGLGNAATPMGIKAMQQLQELNTKKDQASDAMCMFLALNTSSVQLLPPVTLIAIMGTQVSELIIPIILATSASTITAVITAKTFARRSRLCNTAS